MRNILLMILLLSGTSHEVMRSLQCCLKESFLTTLRPHCQSPIRFKPVFHQKLVEEHENDMANTSPDASPKCKGTQGKHIPPACTGVHVGCVGVRVLALRSVGVRIAYTMLLRYHVAIPNAKLTHWGSKPT